VFERSLERCQTAFGVLICHRLRMSDRAEFVHFLEDEVNFSLGFEISLTRPSARTLWWYIINALKGIQIESGKNASDL
jgi:hypothetical protein